MHSITRPVALVSHVLPPSPSGQAVVLHRLFVTWNPEDYVLISIKNYNTYNYEQTILSRLPTQYLHIPSGFKIKQFGCLGLIELVNLYFNVFQRARRIANIVKSKKCGAIIACSGDLCDLPAGYLASRWRRVPFFAYIFDYYSYQWVNRFHRFFARCMEPIILKNAVGIVVPNEFLRDEYCKRYKVIPTVIHNPVESCDIENESKISWPSKKGEIKIVYTGAVYHAHYDAFRNLIIAILKIGRPEIKLHIYTAQSPKELEKEEIHGPIVFHNHMEQTLVSKIQRHADILFMPLAFNSPIPEVIRTSAPGKMGEYLASGRPILVHSPSDSFISWYFNTFKCGLVVDQNNPNNLSQAIKRIIDDGNLRTTLVKNARILANIDFHIDIARVRFLKLFWD